MWAWDRGSPPSRGFPPQPRQRYDIPQQKPTNIPLMPASYHFLPLSSGYRSVVYFIYTTVLLLTVSVCSTHLPVTPAQLTRPATRPCTWVTLHNIFLIRWNSLIIRDTHYDPHPLQWTVLWSATEVRMVYKRDCLKILRVVESQTVKLSTCTSQIQCKSLPHELCKQNELFFTTFGCLEIPPVMFG